MKFTKDTTILIETEAVEENEMRVTIKMNNQHLTTIDMLIQSDANTQSTVPTPAIFPGDMSLHGAQRDTKLYFGAKLTGSGWRIKVS